MDNKKYRIGLLFTLAAGILWASSGTVVQYLIQRKGITSLWLVPWRMFFAGLVLLLFQAVRSGKEMLKVPRRLWLELAIFAFLGVAFCQYTYFSAIGASNSGTATVLQYTNPIMIIVYLSLRQKKMPKLYELICVVLAIGGTFLLATHGKSGVLMVSTYALVMGLLSAVGQALFTLIPARLMKHCGVITANTWAFLLGGAVLLMLFKPWTIPIQIDWVIILGVAYIVLAGTVIAFSLYLNGVALIGPKKASLICTVEPVSATVFTAIFMKTKFVPIDIVGILCILSTIFIISLHKESD